MPLLRYSLYSQNVNLWLAPTADARDSWWPLVRTIGNEGRCFVLSSISCVKRKNLPAWIESPQSSTIPSAANGIRSPARSPRSGRRRSTLTVQEEKHELVLPANDDARASASNSAIDDTAADMKSNAVPASATTTGSGEDFVCRGGSCIIGPMGNTIREPLWEVEGGGLLISECDFEDCERGRLDLDVAGSYSRNDAFKLTVEGLDINPPP